VRGSTIWDKAIVLRENTISEVLAGYTVASGLDATVRLTDLLGAESGAFDLEIHSNEADGVGEVVTTQNSERRGLSELVHHLRADRFTVVPELARTWTVFLDSTTKPGEVKNIAKAMPVLLADIESRGITQADAYNSQPSISAELRRLAVRSCRSSRLSNSPGGYRMQCPSTGGWANDGEAILRACDDFVSTPIGARKVKKLRDSGSKGRHLVIVVTPQDWPDVASALQDVTNLPSRDPLVRGVVDGLWIVPWSPRARAIFWLDGLGWSDVPTVRRVFHA
jgi:hypothetical protein